MLQELEASLSFVFYIQGIDLTIDTASVLPQSSDDHGVARKRATGNNYVNVIVYSPLVVDPPTSFGSVGDLWACTAPDRPSLRFGNKQSWDYVAQGQFSTLPVSHPLQPDKLELVYHSHRLRWYTHGTAHNTRSQYNTAGPHIIREHNQPSGAHSTAAGNPIMNYTYLTVADVVTHCGHHVVGITELACGGPPICTSTFDRWRAAQTTLTRWPAEEQLAKWEEQRRIALLLASLSSQTMNVDTSSSCNFLIPHPSPRPASPQALPSLEPAAECN